MHYTVGRMKINILVGTMTGTAQMCAQEMELALDGDELQVVTHLMDALDPRIFADREAVYLICTSTYGQGDVPDNAKALYEALGAQKPDLRGVRYGVFGLGDRTYAETFSQQRGLPVDVELDEGLGEVPPRIGAELLRVVQEACANVARHADATRIVIRLSRDGRNLLLAVSDNGIGFEASRHQGGQRQGFGLTSMRERVEGLGGRLEIESAPSAGTTVRVSVPLP